MGPGESALDWVIECDRVTVRCPEFDIHIDWLSDKQPSLW